MSTAAKSKPAMPPPSVGEASKDVGYQIKFSVVSDFVESLPYVIYVTYQHYWYDIYLNCILDTASNHIPLVPGIWGPAGFHYD